MPLTTDYRTAELHLCVDVANTVRRSEEAPGPTKGFKNTHGFPTGHLFVALGKVYAALKHYGLNKNLKTCLALSAQENSEFRRKMYPGYKAGRTHREYPVFEVTDAFGRLKDKTPDPIGDFMELACCLPALNLIMQKPKETDDALASYVTQVKKINPKAKFVVMSNDRDLWYLMDGERVICTSKPGAEFGIENLKKDYMITNPKLLPLAKALFGDSSDKIKKAIPRVTEDNIPEGFLDLVVRRPGEGLADAFERTLKANKKKIAGTSLEKCLGKQEDIEAVMNIVRLRTKIKLDIIQTKPDLKRMQTLLKWYELKSHMAPSEAMFSQYRP